MTGAAPYAPLERVTKRQPCLICGKPDWCSISADGAVVLCARIAEGSVRTAANGAHVHLLRRDRAYVPPPRTIRIDPPPPDLEPVVTRAVAATPDDWLHRLATNLKLPLETAVAALRALDVHRYRNDVSGWPMRDESGRVVGIRYRARDGSKWCRPGSHNALFVPWPVPAGAPLFLPEGGSDAAALLALGYPAVAGRPSCNGGVKHVSALVRRVRPPACVVVADGDTPGQRGARDLALLLALHILDVRIITPPSSAKDLRAWVATGAMRDEVELLIAAPRVELHIGGRDE